MPELNNSVSRPPTASMKNKSWFRMQAGGQGEADIYIYDEIGFWGVTAKQFISDMNALGDITHINLHINSPGGDVFEGIAIFNALKNHGAAITVYVDGVAASMASLIAMAGDTVIMPENAFMMIHKPWGSAVVMRRKCALMPNVWTNLSRLWCRYMRRKPEKLPMKLPPCWRMRLDVRCRVSGTRIC